MIVEKRLYTRIPYEEEAVITFNGGSELTRCRDICLKGARLSLLNNLAPDTQVTVSTTDKDANQIRFNARVVRSDDDGVAVEINAIAIDSFVRLRDEIVNSTRDPDAIYQESCGVINILRWN